MITRILPLCVVTLVLLLGCARAGDEPESPAEEPVFAESQEIQLLLQILDSPDEVERNAAFNRLMAIGRPVLPLLEERLRLRAGDSYVDLLRGLAVLPEAPAPVAAEPEQQQPEGGANPDEVARYLVDKYAAAQEMYQTGEYERALALVQGILGIEPTCSLRSQLKGLKKDCEDRITEAKLVKPSVSTRHDVYRTKDRIDLTFRMEDVTPGPVDLDFTGTLSGLARAPKNGQNFLHADITITEYTPYGDSRSWNRNQTWELKENAHLAPSAPWIFPTTLDISGDQAAEKLYRTYTIQAEVRPYLFRTPEGDLRGRRLQFPTITFGVFPVEDDVELLRVRGLELLSKALDGIEDDRPATANDVFLVCLLLHEEDKGKAVDLLMNTLAHPRASDLDKQLVLSCLRQITRLPLEMSEDAWLDWYRDENATANRPPK